MELQEIDHHDNIDDLYDNVHPDHTMGYESEQFSEDGEGDNDQSITYVKKRGITRLTKFRMEYGKPGGEKLSVTFDAMKRISGTHRALFTSFLGDLVREHVGVRILSWKKVDSEARDKMWDEITVNLYYFLTQ